jgi:signal transduction histidine kinase/CheY-like chemotaxis protein
MHMGGGQNGSLEDQLRLIIVNSPDLAAPLVGALEVADIGAWMWVEAERALYFSPRVVHLLGIDLEPRADLMSRFLRAVHADHQEQVLPLLTGQLPAGPFRLRYRFTPPAGPLRWIEDRGRVERSASGLLIRQGGAIRDVTGEVGGEHERREASARLEALVNAMPFAVWGRSGHNLEVTHQNAASIAAWGDIHGRTLQDAPPEIREHWQQQLAEVLTGQILRTRHHQVRHGEPRVIDEVIAPVIVEDQVTGAVGVAIDVTDEARAADFSALLTEISADFASRSSDQLDTALTASLERLGRFLGVGAAALCEVTDNAQVRVTHWWFDPATGRDRPQDLQFDGAPIQQLLLRMAENRPLVIRSRDELPEGSNERAWLAERHLQSLAMVPTQHADGARTILVLAGKPDELVDWPEGTTLSMRLAATLLNGVLARARADANQRIIEHRIQETQKLESLGVLAGGIAHDFNNLLTAILGHASLLRAEYGEVAPMAGSLDQIEAASRRAADLCRQMLAYAGRGRFALHPVDVNRLIEDMRPLLQVTVPRKSTLELSLAPSLPPVLADEAQLRQMITNLVLNASEALREGRGTITIRTAHGHRTADELSRTVFSPQIPEGHYVSLLVSDTGEGMTPETAARIFEPFFSTKFIGRGLGLAAVVGIVRAHKGALRVGSQYGEGSTFELILPASDGQSAPILETESSTAASLAKWRTHGTALVVDDESSVRDLVRSILENAGMTVVLCENGSDGLDRFRELGQEVRMVVLDLTMPGIDGRETLRHMRALREDVPAILMSGYSPTDRGHGSTEAFLQKPFSPTALRAAVKRVLNE